MNSVWIGFDQREATAFAVASVSLHAQASQHYPVRGIVLDCVRDQGLYTRETEIKIGKWEGSDGRKWSSSEPVLWDVRSQWSMSTEFAISRFLTLELARRECRQRMVKPEGWALFIDCDMMFRADLSELFAIAQRNTDHALLCIKHDYKPVEGLKMDGQPQTNYSRKNWSSVMMFRIEHPANKKLDAELVNTLPGRDLHRFCWLDDSEIGELPPAWNWLVGEPQPKVDPKLLHYTRGGPWMKGYENVPFSDEWRYWRNRWAERAAVAA